MEYPSKIQVAILLAVASLTFICLLWMSAPFWVAACIFVGALAIFFWLHYLPVAPKLISTADQHISLDNPVALDSEIYAVIAAQALESIAPIAGTLFQARKIGMHLTIPDPVADSYIREHGEEGRKVIDLIRGNVAL